jgi:hypothetical protein
LNWTATGGILPEGKRATTDPLAPKMTQTYSIAKAARAIRQNRGVNISWIDDGLPINVPPLSESDKGFTIEKLAEMNRSLVVIPYDSGVVVYPDRLRGLANYKFPGVKISDKGRLAVAGEYFQYVRQFTEGKTDIGLTVRGNLYSDMFSDQLTLSQENTLIGHLIELLGGDTPFGFSMHFIENGGAWLFEFIV